MKVAKTISRSALDPDVARFEFAVGAVAFVSSTSTLFAEQRTVKEIGCAYFISFNLSSHPDRQHERLGICNLCAASISAREL